MRADSSTFQTGSLTLITLRSNILFWLGVPCFKAQDYIRISAKLFPNAVTLGELLSLFNYRKYENYTSKTLLSASNKFLTLLSTTLLGNINPEVNNIKSLFPGACLLEREGR